MKKLFGPEKAHKMLVMEDGAPCHTSKATNALRHTLGVKPLSRDFGMPGEMFWPGNSPDLNPIEGMWSELKHRVGLSDPRNKAALTKAMKKEWNKLRRANAQRAHIQSFPERIALVLKRKGGDTGY